jgi:hypothetical protein
MGAMQMEFEGGPMAERGRHHWNITELEALTLLHHVANIGEIYYN